MKTTPPAGASVWDGLIQRRWVLAVALALLIGLGQLAEELLFASLPTPLLIGDILAWVLMSGVAVWAMLTWVARRERRYVLQIEAAMAEQQRLVRQLERSNTQLHVLSTANKTIADSLSLDALLQAVIQVPLQLVPAHAVVAALADGSGPLLTVTARIDQATLEAARTRFRPAQALDSERSSQLLTAEAPPGQPSSCLLLPLRDGANLLGWLEIYGDAAQSPTHEFLAADERDLLETIAAEFAEAMVSVRRRIAAEGALFRLEQAIMEERARIARDIHDGIAQTLAFRRMRIDLWLDWIATEPERLREELISLKQVLREQIAELRRAIFALRPMQFDELGFIGGLQRYLTEFSRQHGWSLDAEISQVPDTLPSEIEAMCFRIVQEALNNVAKHARANSISIVIEPQANGLRIAVRDDGVGIEPNAVSSSDSGLGLRQIRERLAAFHGRLTLESAPGAGTSLEAWFPLAHHSETRSL